MANRLFLTADQDSLLSIPLNKVPFLIGTVAATYLFLELFLIRLHSTLIPVLAAFKNLSLLGCFLGLGVGFMLSNRRKIVLQFSIWVAVGQIVLCTALVGSSLHHNLGNPVSEQYLMGTSQLDLTKQICMVFLLGVLFVMTALAFIPLGQLSAALMERLPKLSAYRFNLVGSCLGVFLFWSVSRIWAPPVVWFLIIGLALIYLMQQTKVLSALSLGLVALGALVLTFDSAVTEKKFYSPYQTIEISRDRSNFLTLMTNSLYFQRMYDFSNEPKTEDARRAFQYYSLPFLVQPNPKSVLIIGAGTGNDVAAALRAHAQEIVAAEIDPAILKIGQELHPEAPYQDPRVQSVVTDARNYIRRTDKKFDLIVYGLLDSHTALANQTGGLRLDSYVYTVEAFREARAKLMAGGALTVSFVSRNSELIRKLSLMLENAFAGEKPTAIYSEYDGATTLIAGRQLPPDFLIGKEFLKNYTSFFANPSLLVDLSTDDWPFLYMPRRIYPYSYLCINIFLLCVSFLFIRYVGGAAARLSSWPSFFLGAAFMLLESKAITEIALSFGSVFSVVQASIVGILIAAFLSNELTARKNVALSKIWYFLAALGVAISFSGTFVPATSLPEFIEPYFRIALLSLPIFFSGICFSAELKATSNLPGFFAANVFGAMVGGFLEYNSMVTGFRMLYLLAALLYLAAACSSHLNIKNEGRLLT